MNNEPIFRIRRLYRSLDAAIEKDLTRFPAKMWRNGRSALVVQDFSGGMTHEEMVNIASTEIGLIAGLEDHLKRWAKKNGRTPERVRWTFENSRSLKVLHDLNNREKHGGSPRDGKGRSGRAPELVNVRRVMQMKTRRVKGSTCTVRMAPDGSPIASGDGSAHVVVTGDIIDSHYGTVGELHEIVEKAIVDCEQLFQDLIAHHLFCKSSRSRGAAVSASAWCEN